MRMVISLLIASVITIKGHKYQTPAVESGHESSNNSNPKRKGS